MNFINKILVHEINENTWSEVESYPLSYFPWDKTGYRPKTEVKMFYTEQDFRIQFIATEEKVRAVNTVPNSRVYQDSCVELFLQADCENDENYINFEINAIGTTILQIGKNLSERIFLDLNDKDKLNIKTDVLKENISDFDNYKPWKVEFEIPFTLLKKYFPKFNPIKGNKIKCNFYKCGDKTTSSHYACLNNIEYNKPSFHRPEFFKEIILK